MAKKRLGKTTHQQFSLYLDEMQANEPFRLNKFDASQPDVIEKSWENLCLKLNSSGGPQRNMGQWKKVFVDWKCNIRKKARKLKASYSQTRGGEAERNLTEIERSINLTGKVAVTGLDLKECGNESDLESVGSKTDSSMPIENNEENNENQISTAKNKEVGLNLKQKELFPLLEEKKTTTARHTRTPMKNKVRKSTFATGGLRKPLQNILEKTSQEAIILQNIEKSLEELVVLKRREVLLQETKLRLKYNVTVETIN